MTFETELERLKTNQIMEDKDTFFVFPKLGELQAQALAEVLALNTTIYGLTLGFFSFSDDKGYPALAEVLATHPTLTQLKINCQNGVILERARMVNNAKIRKLELHFEKPEIETLMTWAEVLTDNSAELDISFSDADVLHVEALTSALTKHSNIKSLCIGATEISHYEHHKVSKAPILDEKGANALVKILNANRTLESLTITFRDLFSVGVTLLIECLKKHPALKNIRLSMAQKKHYQLDAFAEILQENQIVQTMVLYGILCDPGAIADGLSTNNTLLSLQFCCNWPPTEEGAVALAKTLKSNHTLTDLCFTQVAISARTMSEFADALNVNKTLVNLMLPKTREDFYTNYKTKIYDSLKRNYQLAQGEKSDSIKSGSILRSAFSFFSSFWGGESSGPAEISDHSLELRKTTFSNRAIPPHKSNSHKPFS